MEYREFLTWREAAQFLAGPDAPRYRPSIPAEDEEALRQAVITGGLTAYVELTEGPFVGRVFDPCSDGKSRFAEWSEIPIGNGAFELSGWFSLDGELSRKVCRGFEPDAGPWPIEPAIDESAATVPYFMVKLGNLSREAFWFRRNELLSIKSGNKTGGEQGLQKSAKLRSDREENLLRVIAGLWALSGLPPEHNTTADKLSGLFDTWQWDKPAKSTIADTILKEAANLPGARIRTSD